MESNDLMSAALAVFRDEAADLIAQMEALLLRQEAGLCSEEDLHALFRCAHTIKGSAGLFGLDEVVRFTHVVENVLARVRDATIQFSSELVSVLLQCQDHIAGLIAAGLGGEIADSERSDQLIIQLIPWASASETVAPAAAPGLAQPAGGSDFGMFGSDCWHLSLRFSPEVLCNGMDPLRFIKYLAHYGRISHLETITDHLPTLDQADPEQCYLGFELALQSQASLEEIEAVFEFYGETLKLTCIPPHSQVGTYLALMNSLPEDKKRLGEILVACGSLTSWELEEALREPAGEEPVSRLSETPVDPAVAPVSGGTSAAAPQRRSDDVRGNEAKSVKVPADRLDALIDRVGELVIAGASTHAQATRSRQPELQESASLLLSLVEDIRDMALRLRMVAIGEVFSRFPRVVRDVSKELDKQIDLKISGAETELDKSMVDKVGEPLMHLLRNAMDHGIEPAEVRRARGKPEHGTVSLNAYHESGAIMIEVVDDGGGLDPDKILKKAIDKGIVAEGANLSQQDIYQLILAPGFSTAEQVTNLSGRGVGMDVVKSNVEALRGTLDIQSELGRGTTMRLCLPLTLAIIDGFHVGVGDSQFIVPLDMVVECVELPPGLDQVDYMEQRGVALPFVRLRELFGERGRAHPRPRVVIVRFAGKRIGLVVDRIYGKCQTVIKPLGPLFQHVPCVSGSTILGDGDVALILDILQLLQEVVANEGQGGHKPALALSA
ncbi:chemotaxis protein CheA [Chitinimonas lacunae]|uniref:Chemotaxis protein CheA n=1 Tax=Chitinimonas lacunae TaxID=1963018 RepID=A0ABV8MKV3_9NEIS